MLVKKILIYTIVLFMAVALINSEEARAEVEVGIRVGYVDCAGFIHNDDGNMKGYAVDYLKEISKNTGWEYEYIQGSLAENLDRLRRGEIDLMCGIRYTKEKNSLFQYSKRPMGKTTSIIYAAVDNEVAYNDFSNMEGKSFGVLKGSSDAAELRKYANKNKFRYEIITYEDVNKLKRAVINKEIDFMVNKSTFIHKNLKIVGRFGSNPYYFISKKQNVELMEQLNNALDTINSENQFFEIDLFERHYGKDKVKFAPMFTKEELQVIKNSGVLTVSIWPDRKPLSYYDINTGEASGINIDILNLISEKSGLKFNYIPASAGSCPVEDVIKGNSTLAAGVIQNEDLLINDKFILSSPTQESSLVAVVKKGFKYDPNKVINVALTANWKIIEKEIQKAFPRARIFYMDSDEECARAIKSGKVSMLVQNVTVIDLIIQKPYFDNLEIIPVHFQNERDCIAGLAEDSKTLITIINKTIDVLDREEISQIFIKNVIVEKVQPTIGDILYKNRVSITILCIVGLGLIILMLRLRRDKYYFFEKIDDKRLKILAGISKREKSSRYKNGNFSIAESPFDVKVLSEYLASSCYYQCKERDVKLRVFTKGIKSETFIGDQMSVCMLISNIFLDSITFAEPDGSIQFKIINKNIGNNRANLIFQINNTGQSISSDCLRKLFEFENKKSGISNCPDSGWGYFIAKQIVDIMGGEMVIEGIPGTGNNITVQLPFVMSPDRKRLSLKELKLLGIMEEDSYRNRASISDINDDIEILDSDKY
ncbi:MAG: transporter substrate-binding domain-containing protein [Aminipila sp.]